MKKNAKQVMQKDAVLNWMNNKWQQGIDKNGEVIITAGAGDIDTLVLPLKNIGEQF